MNRTLMIIMLLALGYLIGAKWPMIAQRLGVA